MSVSSEVLPTTPQSSWSASSFSTSKTNETANPIWRTSPHRISKRACTCQNIHQSAKTSEAYLMFNLDRFDKVYTRVTHLSMNQKIQEIAELVIRKLRDRGYELFHFVGKQLTMDDKRKKEISILFLIPDSNDQGHGHRILAEIMICSQPKNKNKIENVSSRFIEDYQDWISIHPHQYYTPQTDHKKLMYTLPQKKENRRWDEIMNELISKIQSLKSTLIINPQSVIPIVTKVTKYLKNEERLIVYGFEFELVYRESSNSKIVLHKAIRIGFKTLPVNTDFGSDNNNKNSLDKSDIGAIILLEIQDNQVKDTLVMYKDDWPIVHTYKDNIPPPYLEGLKGFVVKN
ncbi:uncharacterized protein L201_006027 [Kwoniella dendrophila CBS 6074]|uniref:Uncharacterized protein n=1 Tax=Kwoniella dendrophila CBS 6074 TaxID=1295534 RepID=A0AAX4K0K7_9TREE